MHRDAVVEEGDRAAGRARRPDDVHDQRDRLPGAKLSAAGDQRHRRCGLRDRHRRRRAVLPARLPLPPNVAVSMCDPTPSVVVVKTAWPPSSGAVPRSVPPSKKLTVPVAAATPGATAATVAVRVTGWPRATLVRGGHELRAAGGLADRHRERRRAGGVAAAALVGGRHRVRPGGQAGRQDQRGRAGRIEREAPRRRAIHREDDRADGRALGRAGLLGGHGRREREGLAGDRGGDGRHQVDHAAGRRRHPTGRPRRRSRGRCREREAALIGARRCRGHALADGRAAGQQGFRLQDEARRPRRRPSGRRCSGAGRGADRAGWRRCRSGRWPG